jgi:hypothetical protein
MRNPCRAPAAAAAARRAVLAAAVLLATQCALVEAQAADALTTVGERGRPAGQMGVLSQHGGPPYREVADARSALVWVVLSCFLLGVGCVCYCMCTYGSGGQCPCGDCGKIFRDDVENYAVSALLLLAVVGAVVGSIAVVIWWLFL